MTRVEVTVSSELVDAIGADQLGVGLAMFDATIVGTRPGGFGINVIYTLDVPGAPEGAARVLPTYGTHHDGGTCTPFLYRLDWYDSAGRNIHTDRAF